MLSDVSLDRARRGAASAHSRNGAISLRLGDLCGVAVFMIAACWSGTGLRILGLDDSRWAAGLDLMLHGRGTIELGDSQSLTPSSDSCYPTVNVFINGVPREVPRDTTIATLLAELEVAERHVAVEVNLELLPRARHAEHRLCEGDRLEVVTLVGGG